MFNIEKKTLHRHDQPTRDTGCIGSGVLSLGPGPIVAGGRCWLKLLEALEGGLPCGLGGGGGFIAGWTGPVV